MLLIFDTNCDYATPKYCPKRLKFLECTAEVVGYLLILLGKIAKNECDKLNFTEKTSFRVFRIVRPPKYKNNFLKSMCYSHTLHYSNPKCGVEI